MTHFKRFLWNSPGVTALAALVISMSATAFAVETGGWASPAGTGQIIGDDNQVPINMGSVPPMWKARGTKVAMIRGYMNGNLGECGSGFLIGDDCVLTCNHVVRDNSGKEYDSIEVWFDYGDKAPPFEPHGNCVTNPDNRCSNPDIWYMAQPTITISVTNDCALIKLKSKGGETAGDRYGYLRIRGTDPVLNEAVHIIGHPAARCKEYSHDESAQVATIPSISCGGGDWFSHYADTESGSSGSPLFDDDGCVIGYHCGSVASVNCAVKISAVRAAVEDQGCQVLECGPSVPMTTDWGIVIFVLLLLGSSVFIIRRKHKEVVRTVR